MKTIFSLILILLIGHICFGQLEITHVEQLSNKDSSVQTFLKGNRFDYALVTWFKGGRDIISHYQLAGLIKKNGKWHLIQIGNPISGLDTTRYQITILQKQLNKHVADSLLQVMNPRQTFSVTQADLDSLPKTCTYLKDGRERGFYGTSHADTECMAQLKNRKVKTLQYNSPATVLESCYPHVGHFGILRGMVQTYRSMEAAIRNEL